MRKIYQIALAATVACTMVACGNKTNNNGDNADSVKTEEVAQAPSNIGECEWFTVTVPEGWKATVDNDWDSMKSVSMEDVNSSETFKPVVEVIVYKDKTQKEAIESDLKSDNDSKGDDMKIGEYTFNTILGKNSVNHCYTTLADGRLMEVKVVYTLPDAETLKPIVESIKLK
jgi:hypothetical protein